MRKVGVFIISALALLSCEDDKISDGDEYATDKSLPFKERINAFTEDKMKDIYYWADSVRDRSISKSLHPYSFFSAMRYTPTDLWSYIDSAYTSASTRAEADVRGFDNNYGYFLQFFRSSYSKDYYARVCYVYPGSPAARAGLKRGDYIVKANGAALSSSNIGNLLYTKSVTCSVYNESVTEPWSISMNASNTTIDPIIVDMLYVYSGHKIAYVHYTEFVDDYETENVRLNDISDVAYRLKCQNPEYLVLDLRYNRGGYLSAARRWASVLAPRSVVSQNNVIISKHWNQKYQAKYGETYEKFDSGVLPSNMNLSKIVVLTGLNTASASELLISSLKPYMDVTVVGETSQGKYVASLTMKPNDEELSTWALHPIVFAYKNSVGESVAGGIVPDVYLDEYKYSMKRLGDTTEVMLNASLRLLTGKGVGTRTFLSEKEEEDEKVSFYDGILIAN